MIKRRAILISAPGTGDNFLPGVPIDMQRVKKYLTSNGGGGWYDNEIIILPNPTWVELLVMLQTTVADYLFVYFSGHGYTSHDGKRMLNLRDSSIDDKFLLNSSPRQLVVADSCRNFITPGIGALEEDRWSNFTGEGSYKTRTSFDRLIMNSPKGKIIIHATQEGEYSYDSANQGGYFTRALIDAAQLLKGKNMFAPVHIVKLLDFVPTLLTKRGNDQIPAVTYSEGNMLVPFGFITKTIDAPKQIQQPARSQSSSESPWLPLGIAALVIAIIASSD